MTLEYTEPELSPLQDATANRVNCFERVLVNRTDTSATGRSGDGERERAANRVRPTARREIDAGLGGVQRDGRSARQRR